jgi:type IV pilus assembly protein PilQ
MAEVVLRRRSTGRLRPRMPATLALAAFAALPALAGLAALAGCASSSKPARVVEARPAAAEKSPAETRAAAGAAAAATPSNGAGTSHGANGAAEIRSLDLREGAPEVYLDLEASAPLVWTSFRNSEGKVVVELPNAVPAPKLRDLTPDSGLVAAVKIERAAEGSRPMTRLIISTRHEVEHSVSANGSNLQVRLLPLDEAAAAAAPASAPVAPAAPVAPVTPAAPMSSAALAAPATLPTPANSAPMTAQKPPAAAPSTSAAATPLAAPAEPAAGSQARAQRLAFEPVAAEPAPAGTAGTPDQPAMGAAPKGAPATRLETIEVTSSAGPATVIRIAGDGDFPYSTFALESPSRFVIDLQDVVNRSPRPTIAVQGGVVQRVRVAQFKPAPKGVARVVFDLQQKAVPQIERGANVLVVSFPNGGAGASGGAGGSAAAASAASATPPSPPASVVTSAAPSSAPSSSAPSAAPPASRMTGSGQADDDNAARRKSASSARLEKPAPSSTRSRKAQAAAAAPATSPAGAPSSAAATATGGATSDLALRPAASAAPRRSGIEVEDAPLAQNAQTAAGSLGKPSKLPRVAEAGRGMPHPADLGLRNTGTAGTAGAAGKPVGPFTPGSESSSGSLGQTEESFVGEPIDLKVTNADVNEVLRTFAQISGLNVVIQPGVSGQVTAELENVPWDQALYEVLKINNLGYELNGNVMRIAPTGILKQEATERQQLAQARALAIPLKTIMRRLSYANAANIANLLRNGTAGLLSQRGSVIVDDRTNTLIIKELPSYLDTIMSVVENLDTPEPQVIIEARIIETTKRFTRNLGVNWGFNAVADAAHGNTTGLVFPNNGSLAGRVGLPAAAQNGTLALKLGNVLNTFTLDVALQAAESEGLINILSAPKVATLNNQLASIQSGVQIPVQTISNNTVSVQYINATLRLDVTPQVTAEGTVLMDITITKREPQFAFLVPGSTNAPIATKDAKTRLVVRDGGTAVIGGIYQITSDNGENRVPGLAKIPIIGHLFKDKAQREENDELLIFITPRVIKL